MGDLNLHQVIENQLITDIGFIDLWKSTEEDKDGFTWDTAKNGLINLLQMVDNRRMRLDRIIAKKGCSWSPIQLEGGEGEGGEGEGGAGEGGAGGVFLFATEPIYEGSYLQCSDHFGLYTDLACMNDEILLYHNKEEIDQEQPWRNSSKI